MRRTCRLFVSVCALLFVPTLAGANGGPVAWSKIGPDGGVMPRQESVIRLMSEDLRIRLHDDRVRYTVTASYVLHNPGQTRTVLYGVPLTWEEKRPADAVVKDIHLTLNGVRQACRVADVTRGGKAKRDRLQLLAESSGESDSSKWGKAWCVTHLEIPGGQSSTLRLQYTAELDYVDWIFTKSALTRFSPRSLYYSLWPAGNWKGKVGLFNMTVELGPYSGFLHEHNLPASAVIGNNRLTYTARDIDLNVLRELKIVFNADPLLMHYELATWNKRTRDNSRVPIRARVSGFMPSQGNYHFDPGQVTDGNPGTAWCVSNPADGKGAWIEITALRPLTKHPQGRGSLPCGAEGIAFIPAHTHSQSIYTANNRIRKFRVSRCDDPGRYRDIAIPTISKRFDTSAFLMPFDPTYLPWWGDNADLKYRIVGRSAESTDVEKPAQCWRITILDVEQGEKYRDTCISEVALVANCI